MEDPILTAIITASGAIVVAALTFFLTKRHQLDMGWRQEKLNHYKSLLSAISDLAVDGIDKEKANQRFALSANTIVLVAPQNVVTALMQFHDEIKYSNPHRTLERHDKMLVNLLLEIRKDIGLTSKDNRETFSFHLIGSSPKKDAK